MVVKRKFTRYENFAVHSTPQTMAALLVPLADKLKQMPSCRVSHKGVDKKNQLDVTFVFFIYLLLVAQHVSGNRVPIIRS